VCHRDAALVAQYFGEKGERYVGVYQWCCRPRSQAAQFCLNLLRRCVFTGVTQAREDFGATLVSHGAAAGTAS
jgi:hypothetical protein